MNSRDACLVLFVVFDSFQVLDVIGPLQVFATANDELAALGRPARYRMRVASLEGGLVRSSSGVELQTRRLSVRPGRGMHTIFVPGGPGVWDEPARALVHWLRAAARTCERLASVCTGAFLLARTGLLDGGQAVTHWAACDQLAREFPDVEVSKDAIYLRRGALWTSAGVTAGIDMALAMVEADAGREVAMAVAKKLVVFLRRPGGQAQFSSALLEQSAGDERIGLLHQWIADHLREPIDVSQLAERVSMTPRTFARFYLQRTGTTPARAVEQIRLERACALIENTQHSAKSIAAACGFSSEEIMRRAFLRHLKVSPKGYRERFSSQSAGVAAGCG